MKIRCRSLLCRVFPEWSSWTNQGSCSRTCGGGRQKKVRRCLTGDNCDGRHMIRIQCNTHDCAGKFVVFIAKAILCVSVCMFLLCTQWWDSAGSHRFVRTGSWNFNDLREPVINKRMYRLMCISAPGQYGMLVVREPGVKIFQSHHCLYHDGVSCEISKQNRQRKIRVLSTAVAPIPVPRFWLYTGLHAAPIVDLIIFSLVAFSAEGLFPRISGICMSSFSPCRSPDFYQDWALYKKIFKHLLSLPASPLANTSFSRRDNLPRAKHWAPWLDKLCRDFCHHQASRQCLSFLLIWIACELAGLKAVETL